MKKINRLSIYLKLHKPAPEKVIQLPKGEKISGNRIIKVIFIS